MQTELKDYVVFRVDERECHSELAGESSLQSEAVRFVELLAQCEDEELDAIRYEVRLTATGEPIHRTGQTSLRKQEGSTCTA